MSGEVRHLQGGPEVEALVGAAGLVVDHAGICMARKLARRCYHTLRALDHEVVHAMPD